MRNNIVIRCRMFAAGAFVPAAWTGRSAARELINAVLEPAALTPDNSRPEPGPFAAPASLFGGLQSRRAGRLPLIVAYTTPLGDQPDQNAECAQFNVPGRVDQRLKAEWPGGPNLGAPDDARPGNYASKLRLKWNRKPH